MKEQTEKIITPDDWANLAVILTTLFCLYMAFGIYGMLGISGIASTICRRIKEYSTPKIAK